MSIAFQTPESRRKYIANSISKKTWNEVSGAKILKTLQDQGLGIKEKVFYDMRREILGLQKYEEPIRGLLPGTRVPRAWLSAATYWDLKSNFLYRFDVSGVDPNTGKEVTAYYSIGSNTELTVDEAEMAMLESLWLDTDHYKIIAQQAQMYHTFMQKEFEFTP